jgi:hypothetical protein
MVNQIWLIGVSEHPTPALAAQVQRGSSPG